MVAYWDFVVLPASFENICPCHLTRHTPAVQSLALEMEATSADSSPGSAHCDSVLVTMVASPPPAMCAPGVNQRTGVVGACVECNPCKLHRVQPKVTIVAGVREVPVSTDNCTVAIEIMTMVAHRYHRFLAAEVANVICTWFALPFNAAHLDAAVYWSVITRRCLGTEGVTIFLMPVSPAVTVPRVVECVMAMMASIPERAVRTSSWYAEVAIVVRMREVPVTTSQDAVPIIIMRMVANRSHFVLCASLAESLRIIGAVNPDLFHVNRPNRHAWS